VELTVGSPPSLVVAAWAKPTPADNACARTMTPIAISLVRLVLSMSLYLQALLVLQVSFCEYGIRLQGC
jgi:hypothetical protein